MQQPYAAEAQCAKRDEHVLYVDEHILIRESQKILYSNCIGLVYCL